MAAKRDAAPSLAEKLVQVLETQRAAGSEPFPLTLQRLADLTDPSASPAQLARAATSKTFTTRVLTAQKRNPASPVVLHEDRDQLAASPQLLEFVLEAVCTPATPIWPLTKLKMKMDPRLRKPFEEAVTWRIREQTLPSTVGCRLLKNKPQLYLQRLPPPPPPPPPRKPEVVLAEKLLHTLEDQQRQGGAAYPVPLTRLAQLADPQASPRLLKQAIGKEPFKSQAVLALKTHPETPVARAADRDQLAGSPLLLEFLVRATRKATEQVFPTARLRTKLHRDLQRPFEEAVARRLETGDLPPGVGWLWVGKKKQLFLLADVHQGNAAPSLPPALRVAFASAFDNAFSRLDRAAGAHNFVSLVALRRELPLARETFDEELRRLRLTGGYTLSAAEGRHGLTDEDRQAGIEEDGVLLLYVSRRAP